MESNDALIDKLFNTVHTTCNKIFHLTAHKWQADVGVRILEAVKLKKSLKILCVRPTGGGKSLIFNVVATILKGVTTCISRSFPLVLIKLERHSMPLLNSCLLLQLLLSIAMSWNWCLFIYSKVNLEMNNWKEPPSSSSRPHKHCMVEREMLQCRFLSATTLFGLWSWTKSISLHPLDIYLE